MLAFSSHRAQRWHAPIQPALTRIAHTRVGRWLNRWQNWIVGALLVMGVLVACRLWPHPPLQAYKPLSVAVLDDHGRLMRLVLAKDDRYRVWVPLDQMSPQLAQAVLLHEDRWFYWHAGFNPYGLARGAWVTYVRGGNPQGGSTITMQLARALWPMNTRTPVGKLKQVVRALELELFYSKRQILEAYLNDAPYGRNVEGAGTASLIYFNKPVGALTLPEALTLAVIPQDPARRLRGAARRGAGSRAGGQAGQPAGVVDTSSGTSDARDASGAVGTSSASSAANAASTSGTSGTLSTTNAAGTSDTFGAANAPDTPNPSNTSGAAGAPAAQNASLAPDTINRALAAARNRLYARWLARHPQDAALRPLFALPLNLRPLSQLPFEAPHAVEQALAIQRATDWRGSNGSGNDDPTWHDSRLDTTIDLDLQHGLERQVRRYIASHSGQGIRNASAILVDTRDMGIKALVGSADFFDRSIHGQVNGTLARRSPGSTLKPFIYGLGFDQGVLHPQTVLYDVSTWFGPYAPENFDGRFLGPITATDALNRSRNVPAVWVAAQLKDPDLYDFLQQAGVTRLASKQHYGLALVLGGGEVTMQDLASMYAMLVNGGVLKPLRLDAARAQLAGGTDGASAAAGAGDSGKRLLSAEASYMVLDILRQHLRPGETSGAQPASLPVYWKTGTSWAFRDAWTAGAFGPYVLVVWVGNFDNTSNAAFIGTDAAAPLFFQIVDSVEAEHPRLTAPARRVPPGLKRVQICLDSGNLPNEWCPQKGWTWFIPGKSPIRVSSVHRPVVIDDATGLPACPPYAGKRTHQEIYEFWPSNLQQAFAKAGMARRQPPQNPACTNAGAPDGDPPKITSPIRGSQYVIRATHADDTRIAFNASADASAHTLYWFVDNAYTGKVAPGQTLYWQPPSAGTYTVRVVDDHSRSDERPLEVSVVQ